MESKRKTNKIIIVGGGISAGIFLEQLLEPSTDVRKLLPLEIEIIEGGNGFFSGLGWSKRNLRPFHLLNTYIPTDVINAMTDGVYLDATTQNYIKRGECPRLLYGEGKQKRIDSAVQELRTRGVKIKFTPGTSIVDIKKCDKGYEVIPAKGETKAADYVVIATGHWQDKNSLRENEGIYDAWPASKLETIDPNQPIAVLGSSLSAVDAILTLAHHAGKFSKNMGGKVIFTPNPNAEKFKVVGYSPHGMLPSVLGESSDTAFLDNAPPFKEASKGQGSILSLDKFFTLMKDDFLKRLETHRTHYINNSTQIVGDILSTSKNLEEATSKVYKLYEQLGPTEWLKQQIEAAKKSLETGTALPGQRYLRGAARHIELAYNCFYAEDQERFLKDFRPLIAKMAYGMVMSNAEEILALLESGHLEMRATGLDYSCSQSEKSKLPGTDIHYVDADHRQHTDHYTALVKAMGDDPYQLQYASPLMKNLFRSGLVEEIFTPYEDQAKGKHEYEKEQTMEKKKVVHLKNGTYYRSVGGIRIDPHTFQPIFLENGRTQNGLFVIGPLVTPQFPLLQSFDMISSTAHKIVSITAKHITTERLNALQNSDKKPAELKEMRVSSNGLNTSVTAFVTTPALSSSAKMTAIREFIISIMGTGTKVQFVPLNNIAGELKGLTPQQPGPGQA